MTETAQLNVYCDGGSRGNPGPGAAGWVIEDNAGNMRFLCGKYLGVVTNNQAEYAAVELAFQKILSLDIRSRKLNFFLDSLLAVNQLNGLYKIKNAIIAEKIFNIHVLEKNFSSIKYEHIRREKNFLADSLVNQVLDGKTDIDRKEKI